MHHNDSHNNTASHTATQTQRRHILCTLCVNFVRPGDQGWLTFISQWY